MKMRASKRRIVSVALLGIVGLLMFASVAYASGSFTWTIHWSSTLNGRNYVANHTGTHSNTANISNYGDPSGLNYYQIALYRAISLWPDHSYGLKTYNCNYAQTKSWSVGDTGTFYFYYEKGNNGFYWNGSGTVTYPS